MPSLNRVSILLGTLISTTVFAVVLLGYGIADEGIPDGRELWGFLRALLAISLLSFSIVWMSNRESIGKYGPYLLAVFGPPLFTFGFVVVELMVKPRGGGYAAHQGADALLLLLGPTWSLVTIPYWILVAWWSRRFLPRFGQRIAVRPGIVRRFVLGLLVAGVAIAALVFGYRLYQSALPGRAVSSGDAAALRVLLQDRTGYAFAHRNELLERAVRESKPEIVSLLLQEGASPLVKGEEFSPLSFAAKHKSRELMSAIFEAEGPSVDKNTFEQVVDRGDRDVLEYMIQNAVLPDRDPSCRVLHLAIRRGDLGIFRMLLDHGASVDAVEAGTGRTSLMEASYLGKIEFVKMLLPRGAHPGLKDREGHTAEWWATFSGHSNVAAVLKNSPEPYVREEVAN